MPSCAIATCKNTGRNTAGRNISFFRFPRDPGLMKVWILKCKRRDDFTAGHSVVCSEHFEPDQMTGNLQRELLGEPFKRNLLPSAVPTKNIPTVIATSEPRSGLHNDRENRKHERNVRKRAHEHLRVLSPQKRSNLEVSMTGANVSDSAAELQIENGIPLATVHVEDLKKQLLDLQTKYSELEHKSQELTCQVKVVHKKMKASQLQKKRWQEKYEAVSKAAHVRQRNIDKRVYKIFSRRFTKGQIRCMITNKKRTWWEREDILKALSLRAISKKAYLFVRRRLQIPMPGLSTLQRWTKSFQCRPGLLGGVLEIMKAMPFTNFERMCVLSFDEMNIDGRMCYSHQHDTVYGPCTNVQVVMVRGINKNWKQPIYYGFDVQITKPLLFDIINKVENIGYQVHACVSDLGGKNVGVWTSLGIDEHSPSFTNPVDHSRNVWVFADMPHLVKLLRNHVLDEGLVLPLGKILSKSIFQQLLKIDCGEFKLCPKLTAIHLNCKGRDRQRVKYATQLFSHHTAEALKKILPTYKVQADFIQLVNDFFDIFNSCVRLDDTVELRSGYGMCLQKQKKILLEMRMTCTRMRVMRHQTLLPFQKGILLSISSLLGLHKTWNALGYKYILTRRLNQDCLEHLFSRIRGLGHFYDQPLPFEVINRLRLLLIGANVDSVVVAASVEQDPDNFVTPMVTETMLSGTTAQVKVSPIFDDDEEFRTVVMEVERMLEQLSPSTNKEHAVPHKQFQCQEGGLRYVAGYIAFRCLNVDPSLGERTDHNQQDTWISTMSTTGGLIEPSEEWLATMKQFEVVFALQHKDSISREANVIKTLRSTLEEKYPDKNKQIIKVYSRTRTFLRIKHLNKTVVAARSASQSRSSKKKALQWLTSATNSSIAA